MRAADKNTIENIGVPSLVLMERAGEAVANEAERIFRERELKGIILFVCGGGNNGGDGFVAARILLERGLDAAVVCFADKFSKDCLCVKEKYLGEIYGVFPKFKIGMTVDCIFGTGLSRAPEDKNADAIDFINACGAFVLSVDIPSGLDGTSGLAYGKAVKADETITIGGIKDGLILNEGRDLCGEIKSVDIGIKEPYLKYSHIAEEKDVKKLFPKRKSFSNKGSYGKAAIISGSTAYSGAAVLAAKACVKSGSGYTSLCVPKGIFLPLMGKMPEVLLKGFSGEEFFKFSEEDLNGILNSDSIAIGPGAGVGEDIYEIVNYILKNYGGKLVIDADALNSVAKYGADILKDKKCKVVLTPHVKEFSRLCGKSVNEIQKDGVNEAKAFASKYGVTLLLKSNSCIATDGDECVFISEGTPALAKGGSGDVLTGILCSLLARGYEQLESAYAAAFVLARAAKEAEKNSSEYSVTASDVIENIGRALKSLDRL